MHMVHEDSSKSKAVVTVLFSTKAGKHSKLLGDVRSNLHVFTKESEGKEKMHAC